MEGPFVWGVLFVIGSAASAVAFILVVFAANTLLSPRLPTPEKLEPYECGMPPAGMPWAPVRLRFTAIALLLVIFDAQVVLLFAVAPVLKGNPPAAAAAGVFLLLLAIGLVYAWRKGVLSWR